MTELVDVRADAVAPGEEICLGGVAIVVTAVERQGRSVDLHTCYGPAVRLARQDLVSVVVESEVA
jgi:hypothetical protein